MGNDIHKNKKTRVAVIGLGPVGLILATHFHEAGCEVAVCDLDKLKVLKIRKEGVEIKGVITRKVKIDHVFSSVHDLIGMDLDYIVFSVKAHHTFGILNDINDIKNAMTEEAQEKLCLVSAQNGIDVEKILADAFGESCTLRMVINFAGNLIAPNIVRATFFNPPNYIASIDDSHADKSREFAKILSSEYLETQNVNSFELLKRVWEKTILNASLSALCGVGRFTIKDAMDFPNTMEVIEQVIEEAIEVAEAEKIKFEDNFIRKCMRYLKNAGDHFPSLAVDLINNRKTEVNYINGKIVEYGRKHYIRTSLNLMLTNMVLAISNKNIVAQKGKANKNFLEKKDSPNLEQKKRKVAVGNCFVGVDLGSAYTKFTVIDEEENILYQSAIQTLNRDRVALKHVMEAINSEYPVKYICATGYGRKKFHDANIAKTEIYCGAVGVSKIYQGKKNIIDVGGEDIKMIRCGEDNQVDDFSLNDKCAAGTGAFLVEAAERAEISIQEMSDLAAKSKNVGELNSFCTVFAKTEITSWLIDGKPVEDIARGIYVSIANRIAKLRLDPAAPIFMIGGVIAHHPYMRVILEEKYKQPVLIVENSQNVVSLGAALIAKQQYKHIAIEA